MPHALGRAGGGRGAGASKVAARGTPGWAVCGTADRSLVPHTARPRSAGCGPRFVQET